MSEDHIPRMVLILNVVNVLVAKRTGILFQSPLVQARGGLESKDPHLHAKIYLILYWE